MARNESLTRVFEYALQQEKAGKGFFEDSMRRMATGTARSAFRRLVQEEEKHIDLLNRILQGLKAGPELGPGEARRVKMERVKFLDRREKSQFLKECTLDSGLPDACIFNTAYLIEKDLAEFYRSSAENTDGEARKALLMLARWEGEHAQFFKAFKDRLTRVFSMM